LIKIIEQFGATPVYTTPEEHDRAAALISHMPMLIAQAIFKTAQNNKLALEMASSGFRDMTRLSLSNTEMANDMITMNAPNIENSILKLYKSIGDLTNENYKEQIESIRSQRSKMF
jgi:prephenate dehydrogenase